VNGVEVLTLEVWYLNGQHHRTDGPARREWEVAGGHGHGYENEEAFLTDELWCLNGQLHRIDGPAHLVWEVVGGHGHGYENEEAVLIFEEWYLNGRLHRTDGPARREWEVVDGHGHGHEHEETVLAYEEWYLKGVEIHPRILRQPVRAIERWWLFQQARRRQAIESSLWDSGMTVFPGFMGLLREY